MDESADNKQLRWLLTVAVVGGLALLLVWWLRRSPADDPTVLLPFAGTPPSTTVGNAPTTPQIAVDVVGAVTRPGVYYFAEGARIEDAVNAAGGFAPDANREAVNASVRLKDEQQIRIPRVAELAAAAPVPAAQVATVQTESVAAPEVQAEVPNVPASTPDIPAAPEDAPAVASGLLDINRADAPALETLPEIGPVMAQRIVDHRATHGPFERIDQLQDIPGIGPATFDAIRDLVTVNP